MALSKDILGQDLYTRAMAFNDVDIAPADLEAQRLAWWKTIAEGIINHFKTNGVISVNVSTTGTASAQTGSGTGTIS
ncbi:MAG: hypothetical protein KGM16_17880 [Bacteroidota bacterium]|nr:hypothetical protein [Bacteroidota bacterium]